MAIYNNTAYENLNGTDGALKAAETSSGIVYLVQDADLTDTIAANVTLDVAKDVTLTIARDDLRALIGSRGKIKVNAGGGIVVDDIAMIGGSNANIDLQSGSIELQVSGGALGINFNSAAAEIPAGHRWTLLLNDTYNMNPTLDAGSTLTVNGSEEGKTGFHVANGAALTNNGTIVVNTSMSIGSSGEVTGSGTITVSAGGVLEVDKTSDNGGSVGKLDNSVTNSGTVVWNGADSSQPTGTITLLSGGRVYSQADIASQISGSKTALSDRTYGGEPFAYAWQYGVPPTPVDPDDGSSSGSSASGDYLVNVDRAAGGKVTVTPGRADKGDTVTITVKPNDGYVLDALTVTAKEGGSVKLTWKAENKYTFTMPGSQVTVAAVFVKEGSQQPVATLPFTDVAESDWYYDAVQYVYENELMNGTSANTFSPFVTTSRAMILTILARYDGVDTSAGSTWYEAGAVWAIAEGVSDGTNLEADLTREQLVTMLWRYAGSPAAAGDLSGYPDGASVSDWAVNAMIWAVENGVITGNGAGALNSQGTATRAEVATILMRYLEN